LENYEPKVKFLLANGDAVLSKTPEAATIALRQSLHTLQLRWDNIRIRAAGRKTKLADAVSHADGYQEQLGGFLEWLTATEKTLSGLKPASRVVDTIMTQINDHEVITFTHFIHLALSLFNNLNLSETL